MISIAIISFLIDLKYFTNQNIPDHYWILQTKIFLTITGFYNSNYSWPLLDFTIQIIPDKFSLKIFLTITGFYNSNYSWPLLDFTIQIIPDKFSLKFFMDNIRLNYGKLLRGGAPGTGHGLCFFCEACPVCAWKKPGGVRFRKIWRNIKKLITFINDFNLFFLQIKLILTNTRKYFYKSN